MGILSTIQLIKWFVSFIGLISILYGINFAMTYYENNDKKKDFRDGLISQGAVGTTYNLEIP